MMMVAWPYSSTAAEFEIDALNSLPLPTRGENAAGGKEVFDDSTISPVEVDVSNSGSDNSTDDTDISPLAYTQPDLTEFDLVSIKTKEGHFLQRFNLSDQGRIMSTSHTTAHAYHKVPLSCNYNNSRKYGSVNKNLSSAEQYKQP